MQPNEILYRLSSAQNSPVADVITFGLEVMFSHEDKAEFVVIWNSQCHGMNSSIWQEVETLL
jgi:hypothetical protein